MYNRFRYRLAERSQSFRHVGQRRDPVSVGKDDRVLGTGVHTHRTL